MAYRPLRHETPATMSVQRRSSRGWWPATVPRRSRTNAGFTSSPELPGPQTRKSGVDTLSPRGVIGGKVVGPLTVKDRTLDPAAITSDDQDRRQSAEYRLIDQRADWSTSCAAPRGGGSGWRWPAAARRLWGRCAPGGGGADNHGGCRGPVRRVRNAGVAADEVAEAAGRHGAGRGVAVKFDLGQGHFDGLGQRQTGHAETS
jgi:hypothetical protein